MDTIEYIKFNKAHFSEWRKMSLELFPGYATDHLERDLLQVIESDNQETFFAKDKEGIIGFINVSIRYDYVEGSNSSPVGYIEAIFIKPDYRKHGVARKLVDLGEQWVLEKGCTQMGSDTWASNKHARKFHLGLGFKEEDTLVHYIKNLKTDS
ncbi:aminoglycoside 6'-N-acetyltransferase [Ulvibacterium marinum]|uniref:Aminoglycoside N(6')-acetyltransferase type 1 n=1 Tax=Ulvibacterium marinum TaxID=2419782 RepID=A0A3B0C393_9FLAO|nr:aminoglycoside 6'-N-acetyltransferase [Ulvibacterium marinum]RKN80102.1 GNAT family N-acetyltransferase [Ulvibacterium marinum]